MGRAGTQAVLRSDTRGTFVLNGNLRQMLQTLLQNNQTPDMSVALPTPDNKQTLILDVSGFTQLGNPEFDTGAYGYGLYGAGPYGGIIAGINLNTVQLGPQYPRTNWQPSSVICSCDSPLPTTFTAFRNIISPSTALISSPNGNNDNLWLRATSLSAGESIIGVWFGGQAGANCTLQLQGTRTVPAASQG
jgi:hypothetical protein